MNELALPTPMGPPVGTEAGKADRLEIRITGFGGQGVVLAAHIIGHACIHSGRQATMIQSFGPEARGASCSATLAISEQEVLYPYIRRPEILVAMSSDGYETFRNELREGGTLIYELDLVHPTPHAGKSYGIPSTRIAESLQRPLVQNIVMLGFITAVTGLVDRETMREAVRGSVPAGTEEINLRAFDAGAAYFEEVVSRGVTEVTS
jgi:2-oxoglutarate ferredoxin oxidoreductase subunit gamma